MSKFFSENFFEKKNLSRNPKLMRKCVGTESCKVQKQGLQTTILAFSLLLSLSLSLSVVKPERICFLDFYLIVVSLSFRSSNFFSFFIFIFYSISSMVQCVTCLSSSNVCLFFSLKPFISSSLVFCSSLHFRHRTTSSNCFLFLFSFCYCSSCFHFIFSLLLFPFQPSRSHLCMFVFISSFFSLFNFYFLFQK